MNARGPRIAVTPPPICQSEILRNEITRLFDDPVFNDKGRYLDEAELVEFCQEADGLLLGRDIINEQVLQALPRLKIVSKYGVGLDNLDEEALQRHQVALGWTPGVNRRSVAELTLSFMLGLCHNVFRVGFALKENRWVKDGGRQLKGKTVGIIGCGHVGREVVQLLKPFECRIWVRDIEDRSDFCKETGAEEKSFEDVIREADIISLHVPLTNETRSMIDSTVFSKMKSSSFLINTSRGEVVEPEALKSALLEGRLGGAALDVFTQEPPEDRELLVCPQLMVTPHIGGNALEAIEAMARSAIDHLAQFFNRQQ